MATKSKTTATQSRSQGGSTLPKELDDAFVRALKLLDGGKQREALAALEELHGQATEAGHIALVHGVRARLEGLRGRQPKAEAKDLAIPGLVAQVLLTRGDTGEALTLLDKAVLAEPNRATLHYLRALALVRLERLPEAAKALAKAIELEPELRYTYFLEPEFEAARESAPFVPFETA